MNKKKSTKSTRSVAIPFLVTRGWSEFSLIDFIMDEKKVGQTNPCVSFAS